MTILQRLATIIDTLHSKGIMFGDLSANNVLIHPETLDVKIVDLEGAHEEGSTENTRQYTPGFADAGQMAGAEPSHASDYYAFGAIMLYLLTHINNVLELKPAARDEVLHAMTRDFGLPLEMANAIKNLLNDDPEKRGQPSILLHDLQGGAIRKIGRIGFTTKRPRLDLPQDEILELVRESCRFVKTNADYRRKDRLFPADTLVFETNPLSLAHGAAGIAYALNRIESKTEPAILDWIKKQEVSPENYAPGLYIGTSGIAWALLELGQEAAAESLFDTSFGHPLLPTAPGLHWAQEDGLVQYGLAHGASGIGLFLLYLHAATGDDRYKQAAISALDYDLEKAEATPSGGMTWPKDNDPHKVLYPYWAQGSAGIGIISLRFLKALGDPRYLDFLDHIHIDCDRKYTIYPGRNDGLAGIGEFLIDAFQATADEKYLDSAYRIAAGLKIFARRDDDGISFPGNGLARISCDYATGTIGIASFLDRLMTGRRSDFMLDELIK